MPLDGMPGDRRDFQVSKKAVRAILAGPHRALFDQAFAAIIRNRMQRGGIMAPGATLMKQGENGKGLLSRWYPETLKRRILDIVELMTFARNHAESTTTAIFSPQRRSVGTLICSCGMRRFRPLLR